MGRRSAKKRGKAKARTEPDELTDRQQRFVDEYVIDCNGTQAAIRAGYSEATASEQAARLLGNVKVKVALALRQSALAAKLEIKAADVLSEISNIAFSDIGDILDFTGPALKLRAPKDIPAKARRCISGIKVRRYLEGKGEDACEVEVIDFKLWPKLTALEDLAKRTAPPVGPAPSVPPVNVNVMITGDVWRDVRTFDAAIESAQQAEHKEGGHGSPNDAKPAAGHLRADGAGKPLDPAQANT